MILPFRVRLTLWYSGLLAAALLLLSAAVYLLTARALLTNLNSSLRTRSDQVATSAEITESHLTLARERNDNDIAFIPVILLTPSGRIVAGRPPTALRRWLSQPGNRLQPGFHTASIAGWQLGIRSVNRGARIVGYVLVWEPLRPLNEARESLLLVLLTIGPVLLAVAAIGGWTLGGRAMAPVVQVTEAASAISGSDLTRRVPVGPAQDELSELAATFNAMIDRLESAVERERRFTADASHELRSPLAVIRAEATLALDRPRRTAEYLQALSVIDGQAEAMEELLAELLLLTRLEMSSHRRFELVPLMGIVEGALAECSLSLERGEVRLEVEVPEGLALQGSEPLLIRAVRNVVDNAIKASRPGDTVRIRGRSEAGVVTLTVEDSGPGIALEHQEHIFEPFYQVSSARTPGDSHGLGLAICERIVSAHGGHVGVVSRPGAGACFRIDLPEAVCGESDAFVEEAVREEA